MADLFSEVDERMRSARTLDALKRSWPYAAALGAVALLVALGLWGWREHVRQREERASTAYGAGLTELQAGRLVQAQREFATVAHEAPAGYRALALMQQAGLALRGAHTADATRLFDEASHVAADRVIGDAAALKAAYVAMDTAPLAAVRQRLEPLTAPDRPYRGMAREALAFAELAAGQTAQARSDLTVLSLQQDVSENARRRAEAALSMLQSGDAASIAAVVKAQLALPPAPSAPVALGGGS